MAFVTPLFLAFDEAGIAVPEGDGVFLNADLPVGIDHNFWRSRLSCVQPWRDRYLRLVSAGYAADKNLGETPRTFEFALMLIGKHRAENLAQVALANRMVRPGGPIIIGGPKQAGAASLRKMIAKNTSLQASFSKHHWQVFAARAGQIDVEAPTPENAPEGYVTAPGMFSHKSVDPGSALLVEHLPDRQWGSLADFGCGWGYLTVEALKKSSASHVAMIDAHARSLEAAKANLAAHHPGVPSDTYWLDIAVEKPPAKFDTILMNPPFHTGERTDVNLGVAFIEKASAALKEGGQLFMVANRQLPYESVLNRCFRRWEERASDNRFKALVAVR